MKSMAHTVLQYYRYSNVLVIKYFCMTTNFLCTYLRAYTDLLNPGFDIKNVCVPSFDTIV